MPGSVHSMSVYHTWIGGCCAGARGNQTDGTQPRQHLPSSYSAVFTITVTVAWFEGELMSVYCSPHCVYVCLH